MSDLHCAACHLGYYTGNPISKCICGEPLYAPMTDVYRLQRCLDAAVAERGAPHATTDAERTVLDAADALTAAYEADGIDGKTLLNRTLALHSAVLRMREAKLTDPVTRS